MLVYEIFAIPKMGGHVRLADKVAVVTGGASGMGKATVLKYLEEGANVVVADFNEATGEAVVAEAADMGFADNIRFIKTDVASEADVEAMLALAQEDFGGLDIVFNNAGVGGAIGPLTETTVEAWDYTMDVLAKGVFLGLKHAARSQHNSHIPTRHIIRNTAYGVRPRGHSHFKWFSLFQRQSRTLSCPQGHERKR